MTESARALPKGYEFVRPIGAGGCGEVVLARQSALGRVVAIKRIHGYALASGDDALKRFRREAKILATIDHPAVVRVFDFQRSAGDATLVMEYVDGESLADRLARGPMPAPEALVVLRDVAAALQAAAALGVVHRDIKPGNVFLLRNGHAKVGDFGIARIASDPSAFRTSTGEVTGTPAYFPPECGDAANEPDERSDAYSFAVMAYEVLVGQLPYTGADLMQVFAAHLTTPPPPPAGVVPGFPQAASDALLAGLEKEPVARLLPWELVERLEAVPATAWPAVTAPVGRTPVAKSDPTVVAAVPPLTDGSVPPLPEAPRRKRPALSRRTAVATGLVVVFIAAGLVVGHALSGGSSDHRPLHVTSISIVASPTKGRCPKAEFRFTAAVTTNGQPGSVTLRWRRPDHSRSDPVTVTARAGQRSVSAVLRYDVTGSGPLKGSAALHVIAPAKRTVTSEPIRYAC